MTKNKTAGKIYTALVFVFLYAPILLLVLFSFNSSRSTAVFEGFTLSWYAELFHNDAALQAFRNTIFIAVVSSVFATFIGTAAAVGIYRYRLKWFRSSVLTVTNIPMMNPEIVTGISMMLLFVFAGALLSRTGVLGFTTLIIAHITFNLPYVILSVLPKLRQTDAHLSEAAQDLGCTPVQSFFRVVLPAITSGIVTGLIMSFTLSFDDFVISYFVSGPTSQTLPIYIFSMTKKRVRPDIYALSSIIFVSVLALLILINVTQARGEKKKQEIRRV